MNKSKQLKQQTNKQTKQLDNTNEDYKTFVIDPIDISFGAVKILENTQLSIKYQEHYVLIGKNGIGKTSLLNAIATKSVKIPDRLDIIYVKQEENESTQSALEILLQSDEIIYNKNKQLLELESKLEQNTATDDEIELYACLQDEINDQGKRNEIRAMKILFGLGFTKDNVHNPIKYFSGGWRMRISLAKALFITPTLLILDEPTNHLDLHANIWLTNYLKNYPKTLLIVTHDRYIIDEVATVLISIENKKLRYYKCNYDRYIEQQKLERDKKEKDWKQYEKTITQMKHNNKPKKDIEAYMKNNYVERPPKEYSVKIKFMEPKILKGQFIQLENVSASYENNQQILSDVNLTITATSRISLVGANGVGKSTLLKLLVNELEPTSGSITINPNIKIGYYNQHFESGLPQDISGVEYLMSINNDIQQQDAHQFLHMFGLESQFHKISISNLSGGQKARVKFASFGVMKPHILILDEPSNHLDIVTINALIDALNSYQGAIIMVTHNFDLITKINSDLYVVHDRTITQYEDDYDEYITEIIGDLDD